MTRPQTQMSHRRRKFEPQRRRHERRCRLELLEDRRMLAVVAAWSADNTANDPVGGNHGTSYNGMTYAPGQVGAAFNFDGVDDRISVADSPSLKLTESLTIEGWIKASATQTQDRGAIFFRGDDRNELDPYQLTLEPGGSLIFQIQSLTETARMSAPIPLGQFVHVAATLDHATGSMRIYVNSVLMSEITTAVRPFADLDPASNPGIGIGNFGGYPASSLNSPFSGLIDELTVYDQALLDTDVAAHFNEGKGSLQPTLSISDSSTTEGKRSIHFLDRFVKDASGGLNRPRQLAFGPDGNLYVADIVTNSILRYDGATGSPLGTFVSSGLGGLDDPGDLVFDAGGNLLVTGVGSNQLHKYDSTGAFVGIVASGLTSPRGIESRSDGSFLIANSGTNQILKVDGSGVTTFISAGSGGLDTPQNVIVGPDGDVYVVSLLTNSVLKYDGTSGASKGVFAVSPTGGPIMWAEFGSDGALYASIRTEASCCNVTLARFNGTTGALEDSLDTGRDSWSFIMGPDNLIYNGGNGGGNYVDRFVIAESAAITLSLNGPFPDSVSVTYATANGTALGTPDPNSDFVSSSGVIATFAPGEFTKTILVPILDDSTFEGNEAFFVDLSSPDGATIADGQSVVTIIDDELPPTKFYVVDDGSTDQTYEYGATGSSIENYAIDSGNTSPRGAASNASGDTVWVADKNRKVYVYDTSGGLLGSWSAGTLASSALVEGIATNGTDVWIVDSKSDKVFRYTGAAGKLSGSQNAASSFSLNSGNKSPKGIVTDGTYLWIVNSSKTDKVFKYTTSGSLVGSWTIDSANNSPTGLTIDPTGASQSIWIVDSGTDQVYEYTDARARNSGSQSAAGAFNLAANNSNPQGIADPPPTGAKLQPTTASLAPSAWPLVPDFVESLPTVTAFDGAVLRTSDSRRHERDSRVDLALVEPGTTKLQVRDSRVSVAPQVRSDRDVQTSDDARDIFDKALLSVLAETDLSLIANVSGV